MASPYFDGRIFLTRNKMEQSFIPILMFVSDTLEKNVRFVGLWNSHHLHVLVFVPHYLRERELAYLTLKFGKVITLNYPLDLFLDLAVDPSF